MADDVTADVLEAVVEDYGEHALKVEHLLVWVRRLLIALIVSVWIAGGLFVLNLRATERVASESTRVRTIACDLADRANLGTPPECSDSPTEEP